MSRSGILIYLFSFSLLAAAAEQSTPSAGLNRQITLDVAVNDKSGAPVRGLTQQDFTLLDNKQPQAITSFKAVERGAEPLEVVLLVDEVNTNFSHVAYERDQIARYLKRDNGALAHPTSLAVLSDKGLEVGSNVTRDGNALVADLNGNKNGLRTITRSQGFYGATDRLDASLRGVEELANYEAPRPGRKLVIWVSPGWPLLSGPRIELSSKDQQGLFSTVVKLSQELRQAQITLYSIDPLGTNDAGTLRTTYYETFVKGIKKPSQVQIGNLGLQVLAVQSGGRALNSSNDIASEIAKCGTDADAYYVVTFDSLRGDGPNDFHALEMKVDKPDLKVRTRMGYYAQP